MATSDRLGRIRWLAGLAALLTFVPIGPNETSLAAVDAPQENREASAPTRDSPTKTGDQEPDLHLLEGLARYQQGDLEAAGAHWLEAAQGFHAQGRAEQEASALNRAAQARAALGFTQEAAGLLARGLEAAPPESDALRAAILGSMASNLLDLNHPEAAAEALAQGLAHARRAEATALEARLLQSQGELLFSHVRPHVRAKKDPGHKGPQDGAKRDAQLAAAIDAHRASRALAKEAGDPLLVAQAGASLARVAIAAGDWDLARTSLGQAIGQAKALAGSDASARLLIHLGSSFERLAETDPKLAAEFLKQAAAAYRAALEGAESVGSGRSISYALGHLAALEERHGDTAKGLLLTQRAIAAAQPLDAPELIYRWQWQLARLQRARRDDSAALVAYRRAVQALDGLRAGNAANGLDFADEVEPVYFGLVDLLLRRAAASKALERRRLLVEARDQLEELKYAELTDYFQDACVSPEERTSAAAIPGAAVIYPVILPDRTELLLSRTGELRSVIVSIASESLNQKVHALRESLPLRSSRAYRRIAAELYDLLIRPIEEDVLQDDIETLVFVPGGSLRTIPMAALYDSEKREFLVEKRPVAVIPALSLTEPRTLDREKVNTLRAGLTEAVQGFQALEAVGSELEAVKEVFGGRELLNAEFVTPAVASTMSEESFGIVHIATHGQFSARSVDSFLLTYDGKIALEELSALVERTRYQEEPIELLTLSACETAMGDDRAALGLAGVAVRAGARSALATLWTVNDQASADLIAEFYRQLAIPGMSKAQALRLAQLSLLETRAYRHPGYWAAFLMISNWM